MRGANAAWQDPGFLHRVHGKKKDASFQVIVLGSSGGPREDTITGLLVRAPQAEWRKNSLIAVDAGAHLASIIRVLEQELPLFSDKVPPPGYSKVLERGPFEGLRLPHISAKANALYIFRELLHSFLITHPHLDHLSGMGINTPALEFGREAKAIVALPHTIEAIKNHIFNDSIWPNLSDEGHGVGFVTYRRLIEGGNPRLGYGEARGYVNVCDGLATKCWSVSHGKCRRRNHDMSHQHHDSFGFPPADNYFSTRRLSRSSEDHGYTSAFPQRSAGMYGSQMHMPMGQMTPGAPPIDKDHNFEPVCSSAFFIRNDVTGNELLIFGDIEPDSVSLSPRNHVVWDDAAPKIAFGLLKAIFIECSYDDSVRNEDLYGHMCPRHIVAELTYLAKRVMTMKTQERIGSPTGQQQGRIQFGREFLIQQPPTPTELKHKRKRGANGTMSMTPELELLDTSMSQIGSPLLPPIQSPSRKSRVAPRSISRPRRRMSHTTITSASESHVPLPSQEVDGHISEQKLNAAQSVQQPRSQSARNSGFSVTTVVSTTFPPGQQQQEQMPEPLKGLTIHIIHVKDTLADGPSPGEIISGQLRKLAEEVGLGCDFDITSCGESIWV